MCARGGRRLANHIISKSEPQSPHFRIQTTSDTLRMPFWSTYKTYHRKPIHTFLKTIFLCFVICWFDLMLLLFWYIRWDIFCNIFCSQPHTFSYLKCQIRGIVTVFIKSWRVRFGLLCSIFIYIWNNMQQVKSLVFQPQHYFTV